MFHSLLARACSPMQPIGDVLLALGILAGTWSQGPAL